MGVGEYQLMSQAKTKCVWNFLENGFIKVQENQNNNLQHIMKYVKNSQLYL